MIVLHSPRSSARSGQMQTPIDWPKKDRKIFTRTEFLGFALTEEAKDVLKFVDANKIFEWIGYHNQRCQSRAHFILISSSKDQGHGEHYTSNKSKKAGIHFMVNGRYNSWDSIAERLERIDLRDLSSSSKMPNKAIAVDQLTLELLNGGYTETGLMFDTARPALLPSTKSALLAELRELRNKGDGALAEYLRQLVVFEKRAKDGEIDSWECEVIIYSDSVQGVSGSHNSIRLISRWGHVNSLGWWRFDDMTSKRNQRGVVRSPDPIELRLGERCDADQSGPHRIFRGTLDEDAALEMLAEGLHLYRYPTEDHYYSLSLSSGGGISKKERGKTGMNCSDFVLKLLQICLSTLSRDHCLLSANNYLALSLLFKYGEEIPLVAKLFQHLIVPLIDEIGGYCTNLIPFRNLQLDRITSQFKAEDGQPLLNCPGDFGKNFAMAIPEQVARHLRHIKKSADAQGPQRWQLGEEVAFSGRFGSF